MVWVCTKWSGMGWGWTTTVWLCVQCGGACRRGHVTCCRVGGWRLTDGHQRVGRPSHAPHIRECLDHSIRQVIDERGVGVQRRHAAPVRDAALLGQFPAEVGKV